MGDTREKILLTALHLFARDGYEAVSVSDIARALSVTKGALYKHYASKRTIFDSIVERMYAIALRARGNMLCLQKPLRHRKRLMTPYHRTASETSPWHSLIFGPGMPLLPIFGGC